MSSVYAPFLAKSASARSSRSSESLFATYTWNNLYARGMSHTLGATNAPALMGTGRVFEEHVVRTTAVDDKVEPKGLEDTDMHGLVRGSRVGRRSPGSVSTFD